MPVAKFTDLAVRSFSEGVYFDEKTPGFGILIGKRQKTWLVVRGRGRVRTALGHYPELSLADARRQALVAIGTGYVPSPSTGFQKARAEFLEKHGATLRPGSKAETQRILLRHFDWQKSLDKITHQDVVAAIEDIEKPVERAHAIKHLRSFFNWCIPRYLSSNPCVGIKQPRQRSRERVLSDDELRRIGKRADEIGYPVGQITKLLILTGQRRSEISHLRWEWITDTITIPAHIAKNGRTSTIPLGAMAREVIYSVPPKEDLLFPKRGKPDEGYRGFGKGKHKLDECRVTSWTFHDCRRTFATNMAKLGVRLEVTEKLLNHVSGSTGGIVGVYMKYNFAQEMKAAIDLWEQKLASIVA